MWSTLTTLGSYHLRITVSLSIYANIQTWHTVYFLAAHWRLFLLIHDFSLVIGGKLHCEYLVFFIGGKLF